MAAFLGKQLGGWCEGQDVFDAGVDVLTLGPLTAYQTPMPDSSSPQYAEFHAAVYADLRVTCIDFAARYAWTYSKDGGATWSTAPHNPKDVCGGHVQVEVANALLAGCQVTPDGPERVIRDVYGTLTWWTPSVPPESQSRGECDSDAERSA